MSHWKCLVIIFDRCNLVLDGQRYRDGITDAERKRVAPAFADFSKFVTASTGGRVTLSFTTLNVAELRYMSSYRDTSLPATDPKGGMIAWASPADIDRSIREVQGDWRIRWGDYDSLFVVQPWGSATGELDARYHRRGLGYFPATAFTDRDPRARITPQQVAYGATYAWFGASGSLDKHRGELITHEWLHGVCQFYKHYQFPIPAGESHQNPAWKYTESSSDGWNAFYADLLSGNLRDQFPPNTPRGGITNDAWDAGTPSAPAFLVGNGSAVPGEFRQAWRSYLGCPTSLNRRVHGWQDGDIQDMVEVNGRCAIMRPASGGTHVVPPKFWRKFLDSGAVGALGYPVSDIHRWGGGWIIDFRHKSGWRSGLMESDAGRLHLVKGNIWKAYIATQGNGATSYLGYPKGDEYLWTNSAGKTYHVQQFDGGYCWAQSFSPYKYGNNKQWGDQESASELDALLAERECADAAHEDSCCQPLPEANASQVDYAAHVNPDQDDEAVLAARCRETLPPAEAAS